MLTTKQKELLMFIHERLKETGVPPSFDEMKEALDLKSKSGIHRLITALEERGFIRRLPHRARAMEIIKLPDSMPQALGASRSRGFSPSVIEGSLGRVPAAGRGRKHAARPSACRSWAASPPACRSRRSRPASNDRRAAGAAGQGRALRARGEGRLHDRRRHPRRRHHHRQEMRGRRATATSSWRWWTKRKPR